MRRLTMCCVLLLAVTAVAGCGEEFAAGVATGAVGMKKMFEDAQINFVKAVNELNTETTKINDTIDEIEGTVIIRPDTLEALKGLKDREKDPATWVALASLLANGIWAGRTIEKKIRKNGA